jgi:fibronectin-binding autotransporter adhesin
LPDDSLGASIGQPIHCPQNLALNLQQLLVRQQPGSRRWDLPIGANADPKLEQNQGIAKMKTLRPPCLSSLASVAVTLFVLNLARSAPAATVTSQWTDGNSNWNNAANWNPAQVPNNNATDQFVAVINNGSTVTLDISPTITALAIDFLALPASSLVIGNGQALTIASGGLLFNANVVGVNAPGTGVLVLNSATNINAGNLLASGGGTFEVNGAGHTIDNSSGTITALDGSSVVLFGFGTTVSGGTIATAGTGVVAMSGFLVNLSGVTNTGTFAIPAASALDIIGTSTNTGTMGTFAPGVGVIFIKNGMTLNNTGTLLASGGGNLQVNGDTGGTINNTSGAITALNGSRVDLFNGVTVNGGTLATTGTGVIEVSPGFIANLSAVTNTGTFAVPGTATVEMKGPIANTGTMGTFAPGIGVIVLNGQTLTNTGTLLASGGGTFEVNGGTINNSFGTITALNGSSVHLFNGVTVNGGTIATTGTGVVEVSPGFIANLNGVTNTGIFAVPGTATLEMKGPIANTGTMGTFAPGIGVIVPNGQTLTNTGTLLASGGGTFEVNGGTVTNNGTFRVDAGSRLVLFNGPTLSNFNPVTGTLTGGNYVVTGTLQFDNANIVNNAANIVLNGFSFAGNIVDQLNQDAFRNFVNNTGSLSLEGGKSLSRPGNFTNSGAMNIALGSGFNTQGGNYTQTAGTTNVDGSLFAAGASVNIQGGKLTGTGSIFSNVDNSGGTVAPGNSPGVLLVVGNYTQTAGGSLDIEIGGLTPGTQYDQLAVAVNASLAGELDVELINGFSPTTDASFDIILAGLFGTVSGTFNTLHFPTLPTGTWDILYRSDLVRVTFDFDETQLPPGSRVPEPAAIFLVAVGFGILLIVRRKERTSKN